MPQTARLTALLTSAVDGGAAGGQVSTGDGAAGTAGAAGAAPPDGLREWEELLAGSKDEVYALQMKVCGRQGAASDVCVLLPLLSRRPPPPPRPISPACRAAS